MLIIHFTEIKIHRYHKKPQSEKVKEYNYRANVCNLQFIWTDTDFAGISFAAKTGQTSESKRKNEGRKIVTASFLLASLT